LPVEVVPASYGSISFFKPSLTQCRSQFLRPPGAGGGVADPERCIRTEGANCHPDIVFCVLTQVEHIAPAGRGISDQPVGERLARPLVELEPDRPLDVLPV